MEKRGGGKELLQVNGSSRIVNIVSKAKADFLACMTSVNVLNTENE